MTVYMLEKSEEEDTVLVGVGSPVKTRTQQGGLLLRVLNLEKESTFGAGAALHRLTPPGHIFSAH